MNSQKILFKNMVLKDYTSLGKNYRYKINKITLYLYAFLSILILSKLFSQTNTLKTFNYSEDLNWENPEWENPEKVRVCNYPL